MRVSVTCMYSTSNHKHGHDYHQETRRRRGLASSRFMTPRVWARATMNNVMLCYAMLHYSML